MIIRLSAQHVGEATLTTIAELALRTIKASVEPPIIIDAGDPKDYRPMKEAA